MRAPLLALIAVVLAGCWSVDLSPPTTSAGKVAEAEGPAGAPTRAGGTAPAVATDLPGVDTTGLTDRERLSWWRLVSQLYSPCSEQAVSVAQCVKEARRCAACAPAAMLLAAKVHEGATTEQGQAIYALRFGPDVKTVDATDSPTRGPADAPVTVAVWSDFECPHCKAAQPLLDAAVAKFAPRVRLVHKFYRLSGHSRADAAARAAVAALNQGRYWEMEHLLFQNQHDLTDTDLDKYAGELKLDLDKFHADVGSDRTTKLLKRDQDEADRDGLSGTPFILVNGRAFDLTYFHPASDLEPWIETELGLLGRGQSKQAVRIDGGGPPAEAKGPAKP